MSCLDNKVVKNSIIYTVSGLLIKCFNFFLLPLYTAYLTTSDYGITSIATSFLNTMSYIATFSLFSAVMRFFVDLKEDPEKLKRFYGTVVNFVLLSGGFFFMLLTALRTPLSRYVFSGVDYFPVIVICLVTIVFNCQHLIYENILRSQQKAMKCAVLSLAYFGVLISGNIFFVVVLRMGAVGVLLATLLASMLYTLFFVIDMYCSGNMAFCLDLPLLKDHEVNYVEEPLVVYHIHSGERITDNPKKKIAGLERLNDKYADYLAENPRAWFIRNIKIAPFYAANGRLGEAMGLWWKCVIKMPLQCEENLKYLYHILKAFIDR